MTIVTQPSCYHCCQHLASLLPPSLITHVNWQIFSKHGPGPKIFLTRAPTALQNEASRPKLFPNCGPEPRIFPQCGREQKSAQNAAQNQESSHNVGGTRNRPRIAACEQTQTQRPGSASVPLLIQPADPATGPAKHPPNKMPPWGDWG